MDAPSDVTMCAKVPRKWRWKAVHALRSNRDAVVFAAAEQLVGRGVQSNVVNVVFVRFLFDGSGLQLWGLSIFGESIFCDAPIPSLQAAGDIAREQPLVVHDNLHHLSSKVRRATLLNHF